MDERRKADVVATMPVPDDAHLMMVTDGGKLIRMRISDIKIAGRSTMGVILFRLDKDEKVVSATCITDVEEEVEETQTTQPTDSLNEISETDTVKEVSTEEESASLQEEETEE